jgi:hypothetical protein
VTATASSPLIGDGLALNVVQRFRGAMCARANFFLKVVDTSLLGKKFDKPKCRSRIIGV